MKRFRHTGDFNAYKLILSTGNTQIHRWYSPGIGLIREASYDASSNPPRLINDKKLNSFER